MGPYVYVDPTVTHAVADGHIYLLDPDPIPTHTSTLDGDITVATGEEEFTQVGMNSNLSRRIWLTPNDWNGICVRPVFLLCYQEQQDPPVVYSKQQMFIPTPELSRDVHFGKSFSQRNISTARQLAQVDWLSRDSIFLTKRLCVWLSVTVSLKDLLSLIRHRYELDGPVGSQYFLSSNNIDTKVAPVLSVISDT